MIKLDMHSTIEVFDSHQDTSIILYEVSAQKRTHANWLSQMIAWGGSIVIIIGFFFLQIRLTSLPQDWAQTTLLILTVIGEIWLIGVWNRLFG